jgi:uncharacterized protein (TIGR01777 family)
MNVVITGANGFIGSALARRLASEGDSVAGLVRNPAAAGSVLPSPIRVLAWNPASADEWREAVAAADVVVHLAGASLGAKRWTPEYKQVLRDSRVETTKAVVAAMRESGRAGRALLSGSAVGYYGDGGDRILTEADPAGRGFLAEMCFEWEAEAARAGEFGARVVTLRTGIVLGEGGALEKMLPPFRLGLGGPLGSGRQWMPWIHLEDAVGMIAWAARAQSVRGPINVVSPNPVTMREFAAALGSSLHRPALFPVPGFALRLLLGEFAEALLTGQRLMPEVARKEGFEWRFPELAAALRDVVAARPSST